MSSTSNHPGSRKVTKVVKSEWSDESMSKAIEKIQSTGASIRGVAKEFGVNESTLRFRLKKAKKGEALQKCGRKCAFSPEEETKLAKCIRVSCNYGFSPSISEIQKLVALYVEKNGIKDTQFREGRPGNHWIRNFMTRNKLTLKKAEMTSTARMSNTSNPFIIYDFFDTLQKIFQDYPSLDASRIWNCDESGFPTDPSKGKVVCPKGKRALKQRRAGRENITVLAVCNAAGVSLDPLIIFKGKNILSNWIGDEALPNTYYGKSENGWMETDVFADWFTKFADSIAERPLLLIFDGHMTHISLPVIERSLEDDIILIKFPPHVTDVLQPLDVACFGPLKRRWEQLLQERANSFGAKSSLTKADFVNQLCKIWRDGMKADNVISGFSTTGIYPVDRTKYPVDRLNKLKLLEYNEWKKSGRELDWDRVNEDQCIATTSSNADTPAPTDSPLLPSMSLSMPIPGTPKDAEEIHFTANDGWNTLTLKERQIQILGPYPCEPPPNFEWVPNGWKLVPKALPS